MFVGDGAADDAVELGAADWAGAPLARQKRRDEGSRGERHAIKRQRGNPGVEGRVELSTSPYLVLETVDALRASLRSARSSPRSAAMAPTRRRPRLGPARARGTGFSGVVRVERGGTTLLEQRLRTRQSRGQDAVQPIDRRPDRLEHQGLHGRRPAPTPRTRATRTSTTRCRSSSPTRRPTNGTSRCGSSCTHVAGFPIGLGGDFEPLTRDQLLDAA